MQIDVSNSKLKTWRRCKRQYHYKYVEKLKKKHKSPPLLRGTIIHDMIEYKLKGWNPFNVLKKAEKEYGKLFIEEQELYGNFVEDIRVLMQGYFDYYKADPFTYDKIKGKIAEHYFKVELTKGINLIGYVDNYGHTRDKLKWVVERKSTKNIPEGDYRYSDIQSALYVWALPKIGFPQPDGVMWDYIKTSPPTPPELLKNGTLSTRKNMNCTWSVYEAEIKRHKLKVKDYLDMKEQLEGKEADFYVRKYLPVNKQIVAGIIEDAVTTAKEIALKAGKIKTRNIDKHCEWCDYYNLCQAELRGLDADFIRKSTFIQREQNEKEDIKKEARSEGLHRH